MGYPVFASGDVLNASDMNAVGLWRVTDCTVTSSGGTAATASNGVITLGTGNTSVTVNSAFSSNYNRYRITIDNIVASNAGDLQFRVGSATAQYYGIYNYQISTGTSNTFYQNATGSAYIGGLSTSGSAGEQTITFDISQPNQATRTSWTGQSFGNNYYFNFGYQLADTTQHTSFTIFPTAGTLTGGQIRVYGYQK